MRFCGTNLDMPKNLTKFPQSNTKMLHKRNLKKAIRSKNLITLQSSAHIHMDLIVNFRNACLMLHSSVNSFISHKRPIIMKERNCSRKKKHCCSFDSSWFTNDHAWRLAEAANLYDIFYSFINFFIAHKLSSEFKACERKEQKVYLFCCRPLAILELKTATKRKFFWKKNLQEILFVCCFRSAHAGM